MAFGQRDYSRAIDLLAGLPELAHRIGGSHAQRDLFAQVHLDARRISLETYIYENSGNTAWNNGERERRGRRLQSD